ncbi:MAG: SMC-Scp complex subunit ScpB, partial [Thermoanaerobaculia bacterium]|nr:SMC-Scp complex subunit ScpB [Thermoanaerobaculia bacterium]
MNEERPDLEAAIEAILFVAGEPLSRNKIVSGFEDEDRAEVSAALDRVVARYEEADHRGVMAESVAGGVRVEASESGARRARRHRHRGGADADLRDLAEGPLQE